MWCGVVWCFNRFLRYLGMDLDFRDGLVVNDNVCNILYLYESIVRG